MRPGLLLHRHRLTPYAGRPLTGVVRRTWLRGVGRSGAEAVPGAEPAGRLLTERTMTDD